MRKTSLRLDRPSIETIIFLISSSRSNSPASEKSVNSMLSENSLLNIDLSRNNKMSRSYNDMGQFGSTLDLQNDVKKSEILEILSPSDMKRSKSISGPAVGESSFVMTKFLKPITKRLRFFKDTAPQVSERRSKNEFIPKPDFSDNPGHLKGILLKLSNSEIEDLLEARTCELKNRMLCTYMDKGQMILREMINLSNIVSIQNSSSFKITSDGKEIYAFELTMANPSNEERKVKTSNCIYGSLTKCEK